MRPHWHNWTVSLALIPAILAGCGGSSDEPSNQAPVLEEAKSEASRLPPTAPATSVQKLTRDNAAFALDLLHAVGPDENFFYSPHSISIALAMTYAGAAGDTKAEMKQALHFDQSDSDLNAAFNSLDQALAARGKNAKGSDGQPFRLRVSNAAWAQRDYTFLPTYLDVLAQSYGAGIKLLDFVADTEGSRKTINDWVSVQTEGKIPELLEQGTVNGDTRLVLTNTVYFNASWATPFAPADTKDGTFEKLDQSSVTVPMMHGAIGDKWGAGPGWQAAEIDYDGAEVSFLAILPDAGTFESFEQSLDAQKLDEIVAAMQANYEVNVTLPRFEFRSKLSLAGALAQLGMPTAFTPAADFSAMNGSGGLMIQDVIHEGFVKVNEAGTEAAAATAVSMGITSAPEPKDFEATRPFLFVIRDRATGAAIFIGRVVDPSA